jgi:hypothetical protein
LKQSFVEDRTNDYEAWNQPLRSFQVTEARDVTAVEANRLVGLTETDADAGLSVERYHFNAAAVRFVFVKSEAKYISESGSNDGYTAPTIHWYTRTDRYEYVLELGAAGKVLGGEWVGSSKQHHPDFLWLPLGAGTSTVAEGRIDVELVKALVLESSGTAGAVVGSNLTVVRPDAGVDGGLSDGGVRPDAGVDGGPTDGGVRPDAGGVDGGGVDAGVVVDGGATDGGVTHLSVSGSVAQGQFALYTLPVIAGRAVVLRTTAPRDVDVYVRLGAAPTTTASDARADTASGNETLRFVPAASGTFHVGVHGYSAFREHDAAPR